jgi:RNA recognition motif-containing protein
LFIGGLKGGETDEQAREAFGEYGEIKDLKILEGFGFIEFTDAEAAGKARTGLNGSDIFGTGECRVLPAKPRP